MLLTNGLLTNDVLRWKAIGAAAWLAAVVAAASAAWSLVLAPGLLLSPLRLLAHLFGPSGWLAATGLVVAQAPAFAAQAACLRGAEPRPPRMPALWHLPRTATGPLGALLSKLAARGSSAVGAARLAAFLGLHALSAVLSLSLDSAGRTAAPTGASWTLQYGLWLAAAFLLHWCYWSQDVVQFPAVQRHRYFRLKQRLPGAAAAAAKLAAAAFACAAATAAARARALGAADAGAAWPPSLGGSAAALLAGAACTFCWLMAAATLEVVFTERLRADDYSDRDALAAQAACLGGKRGELMAALALHDASRLAGDVGRAAARRADLFADETGDRWKPVAAACIGELDALSAAVAAALTQQKPAAAGTAGAAGAAASGASASQHRWNVLPSGLGAKGAGLGAARPQLEAVLEVRRGYPRAAAAAHALAGFAAASLAEDRFGVLQLSQPGLGEVLLCLLGSLAAAQQLLRSGAALAPRHAALGPWRSDGDAAPYAACYACPALDAATLALQDTLTVSLYRLAAAFGDGLAKVLAESKGTPAFGTPADAAALLQQCLKGQL